MFLAIRKRLDRKEEGGFTLIELMVVVLIIAILIAIAIPTFLGARKRAQDRGLQSNLRNAFTAEKVIYTDAQAYAAFASPSDATCDLDGSGACDLTEVEPSLTFVSGNTPVTVSSVYVSLAGGFVYISGRSASGSCFALRDNATVATSYAKDTDGGACPDVTTLTYASTPW